MTKGIKEKDIREFIKLGNKLNDLISKIREYCPEANLYTTPYELYLMNGSESDENIVQSVFIEAFDGGDW